jgi:hypothetical protein
MADVTKKGRGERRGEEGRKKGRREISKKEEGGRRKGEGKKGGGEEGRKWRKNRKRKGEEVKVRKKRIAYTSKLSSRCGKAVLSAGTAFTPITEYPSSRNPDALKAGIAVSLLNCSKAARWAWRS